MNIIPEEQKQRQRMRTMNMERPTTMRKMWKMTFLDNEENTIGIWQGHSYHWWVSNHLEAHRRLGECPYWQHKVAVWNSLAMKEWQMVKRIPEKTKRMKKPHWIQNLFFQWLNTRAHYFLTHCFHASSAVPLNMKHKGKAVPYIP